MKKETVPTHYWLVVGSPEHWQVAFENGNVWGLQATKNAGGSGLPRGTDWFST